MIFQIELAGRIVEIHSLYEKTYYDCHKYIVPTLHNSSPDIVIKTELTDIKNNELDDSSLNDQCKDMSYSPDYLESLLILKKIAIGMLQFDTVLMHGAAVSTEGKGFMITAPSGVGKTTRTMLWIDNISNSIVVNGDKPLIKISNDKVYVCGTPWSGKECWNNRVIVPLQAIFLLERAEDHECNLVEEVKGKDAFISLYMQTFHPKDSLLMRKTLQLLKIISENVKIYRFRSKPTAEAVRLAYDCSRKPEPATNE